MLSCVLHYFVRKIASTILTITGIASSELTLAGFLLPETVEQTQLIIGGLNFIFARNVPPNLKFP